MSKKYLSDFNQEDEVTLTFTLQNVPNILAIGNAIRRAMYSLIPIYAFDVPIFIENSTNEIDEIISQRLQCIPIYNEVINSKGKGKPIDEGLLSSATFQLSVTNGTENTQTIHASELICSTKDDIEYFNRKIIITNLRKDESLNLSVSLVKGVGLDNQKFFPVSVAYYTYPEEYDVIPKKLFYTVETKGGLSCLSILRLALSEIRQRLNSLKLAITSDNKEKISSDMMFPRKYRYSIINEDHTLGYLLSNMIFSENKDDVDFCEMVKRHPIIDKIELYIIIKEGSKKEPNTIIVDTIDIINKKYIEKMLDDI